ncbi:UbiA prenyltransferase family-domain-containing protein [Cubamyces menziesii]|nr:UbiA prenyltransferase family-domain-containing protein [Cubamyces menziesii]
MLGSVLSLHSGFPSASLPSNARIGLSFNLGKAVRKPWNFAYTLWLFTFSDLKTILFPTLAFGIAASPDDSSAHVGQRALWIWLHLLQFCVSNQRLSPQEDATNKPWRPIPAGRLSMTSATWLRWALLPACLTLSIHYDVVLPSVALALGTLAHNEFGMDSQWLPRNVCNAVGYAAFNAGATYAACGNRCTPKLTSIAAQVLNALVILTTIQAQDFQDTEGDRATGRTTLPIVFPRSSRWAMIVLLTAWSTLLSAYWQTSAVHAALLALSGAAVGSRFVLYQDAASDRLSYRLYNVRPRRFAPVLTLAE